MDQQFSHCAGRLTGTRSEHPAITCTPSPISGWIGTISDEHGTRISLWAPTEQDCRYRLEALYFGVV
jgi:hypothetical protein